MKQKLTLLILALFTAVGAWAFDVAIASDSNMELPSAHFGAFSGQVFTTSAASGLSGVTITAESGLTIDEQQVNVSYYGYSFKFVTSAASTPYRVTLSAPDGYKITGYSLKCSANSNSYRHTLTSEDGTSIVEVSSPPFNSPATSKEFNVTGLSAQTTYFTISTASGGNTLYIPYFTIFLEALDPVNITYIMMYNGSSVATFAAAGSKIGAAPAIPGSAYRKYCTYAYYSDEGCTSALTELPSTEATVYTKVTYTPPFTVSSGFDGATWYYLYFNRDAGKRYLQMNPAVAKYPTQSSKPTVSEALWAFTGDPYNGIKVMNARAGEGYYLKKTGTSSGNAITIQSGGTTWNVGTGNTGFLLYDKETYPNNYTVCMHDYSSSLAVWNSFNAATDKGSAIVVEDAAPIKVTYKLTYNGNVISSYTKDLYELVGATASAPFDWELPNYCSLGSCTPATITAETTEVTIPLNWNGPFELSTDYEHAVWFYLNIGGKWAVYDGSSGLTAANSVAEAVEAGDNALWAFVGNPTSLKVFNKGAGSTKKISVDDELIMITGDTYTECTITEVSPTTFRLDNETYYMAYLNSSFTNADPASNPAATTIKVCSYYYYQQAISQLSAYESTLDQYLGVTSISYNNVKSVAEDINSESSYNTFIDSYTSYLSTIYPSTGFYRIKSSGTRDAGAGYITYGEVYPSYGNSLIVNPSGINDLSSIIHFTKVSDGVYTFSLQGLNVQATSESAKVLANENEAVNYTIAQVAPGYASISSGSGRNYFHEANWTSSGYLYNPVVGWDAPASSSNASAWIIEDVTPLTINLNSDGAEPATYYATFCAPFSYTVGSGTTAYTLEESGDYLVPTLIDGEVAAGTPVLLKGTSPTATLKIGSGYAATPVGGTALTGTYLAKPIDGATDYVLGIDSGVVGFYHWNTNTLGANRAYYDTPAAVKGFVVMFDNDVDGINSIENGQLTIDNEIYNLAGQRMNKMQKGINIVNGKKILK